MEQVYAIGVYCIQAIQYWFKDYEHHLQLVNDLANPHYAFEYALPFISAIDSVFGAQFLLCLAFGSWTNCILKWLLSEDRPYWWVRETSFYSDNERPTLYQSPQTCETGPGSPSGHSTVVAMELMLAFMWICHVMNDRWLKYLLLCCGSSVLIAAMLARVYVAAHFPHQCLVGAACGIFLAPFLCLYVTDPYIWGNYTKQQVRRRTWCHVTCAVGTIVTSGAVYWGLRWTGHDPQYSIRMAFKWCEHVSYIHVSTTPLYSLTQSTASLVAGALVITPTLARYRHYTKRRSLAVAMATAAIAVYGLRYLQGGISKESALWFYAANFVVSGLKTVVFLRLVPYMATWPYVAADSKEKNS